MTKVINAHSILKQILEEADVVLINNYFILQGVFIKYFLFVFRCFSLLFLRTRYGTAQPIRPKPLLGSESENASGSTRAAEKHTHHGHSAGSP